MALDSHSHSLGNFYFILYLQLLQACKHFIPIHYSVKIFVFIPFLIRDNYNFFFVTRFERTQLSTLHCSSMGAPKLYLPIYDNQVSLLTFYCLWLYAPIQILHLISKTVYIHIWDEPDQIQWQSWLMNLVEGHKLQNNGPAQLFKTGSLYFWFFPLSSTLQGSNSKKVSPALYIQGWLMYARHTLIIHFKKIFTKN